MTTIGFVILSHRGPEALLRLSRALNILYDGPPIVCHHDFSQAKLDRLLFPANLRFVDPSRRTSWGKWAVVEATLAALRLLYADGGPDWFVLLSAADYPIRSGREVADELAASPFDAFLDAHPLDGASAGAQLHAPANAQLGHFEAPGNVRLSWRRYIGAELWLPRIRREPRWRVGRHTLQLPWAARGPFGPRFGCFYGDHWFTANRQAAGVLLRPTERHLRLRRHLRMRACVDECYYQTVLCNAAGLSISLDNKRYAEWNGGGAHPMDLTESELPAAFASGAHFARKFTPGSPALDALDAKLSLP